MLGSILFHVVTGLLGLLVVLRVIRPMPWPAWLKIVVSVVILVTSVHHLWTRLAFGTMFSPEVPRAVVIAANWIFGSTLLAAAFQVCLDLGTLLLRAVHRRHVVVPTRVRYATGAVALSLAAFGVGQAIRVPLVKEVEIAIKGLPREFDGFRLVQLTDLHISRLFQAPWVEALVRETNALNPNMIVITGDLIDGTLEARREDVQPIGALRAPAGVYAIPGNHEYYFGYPGWMARFEELGLRTLANSHVVIRRGEANLVLAGVTDVGAAARAGFPGPDIGSALEGAPAAPIIMLDHQPRNAALAARAGASLQLSGHTHGGLIVGLDRLIATFNSGYVSGHYDVEGMPLYVNNGTALWLGFAVRLGRPSELTSIVLRAR